MKQSRLTSALIVAAFSGILSAAAQAEIQVIHTWTMGDEEKGGVGNTAAATLVDTVGDLDLTLTGEPKFAAEGSALGVLFANTGSAHNVAAAEYYSSADADVNPGDFTKWGIEAIVRIDVLPATSQEMAVFELGAGPDGILLETYGNGAWALHQSNVAINASPTPVQVGKLQHLAAVRNNGRWELYVDGLLIFGFNSAEYEPAPGIRIGAGNSGTGDNRGFEGLIDTVRVFEYTGTFNIRDTLVSVLIPDADKDGFDDSVEIALGFNPNDANSTPESKSGIETAVQFSFYAAKNGKYTIQSSSDLQNWEDVEKDIMGTGGEVTRLYTARTPAKRYFRSVRQAE